MFVYRKSTTEPLWTVGYYDPTGYWYAVSDHGSEDAAIRRVNYLNGGTGQGFYDDND